MVILASNTLRQFSLSILFAAIYLVTGCSHIGISGKKLIETSAPLTRTLIFINDKNRFGDVSTETTSYNGVPSTASTRTVINPFVSKDLNDMTDAIVRSMEKRFQIIFEANGLPNQVQRASQLRSVIPLDRGQVSHVLSLAPVRAGSGSNGAKGITFDASIFETASKKMIWSGTLYYGHSMMASVSDKVTDEFLSRLLIQLNNDKVIKLASSDPILPKE